MKIIIDDKIPFIRGHAERLGTCVYASGASFTPSLVRDADMLIVRTRTHCDRALLEGSSVRYIVTATIGYDHLDLPYLREKGIAWTNCPGCNAGAVAQYVYTSLCVASEMHLLPSAPTIGIVGVGHVGQQVAQLLRTKGYRLLLNDPLTHPEEIDEWGTLQTLARECDVITLHTPLTFEGTHATHHLLDRTFFEQCQRQPLIINAARGGVVCESALLRAMEDSLVSNAIIDTWENEPHINTTLLEKALLATPHIAGYSADGKSNATRMSLTAAAEMLQRHEEWDITPPEWPKEKCYNPYIRPSVDDLRYYDPRVDSNTLKHFPTLFENLRGHYPLRREPQRKEER